jgi:ADP-ribose pyrophosphatase YjhB (NUDIX family)
VPEDEPQACGPEGQDGPAGQSWPDEPDEPDEPSWPDERFSHEALAVVLQVRRNSLHVLLWQRGVPPFEGLWALPGGPLGAQERLGTSLGRHLATKVDLTDVAYLEQLETRSDPGRDPRGRVLATAYLALISADVEPRIPGDTAWHRVEDLPPTAFDHGSIAESGRDRLRAKLSYTNIGFALAPETFTIAQLRDIYAASLGHPVSATNLQRVLTRRGVIEATPAAARPTSLGGRPATLYRFATRTLIITNPFAAFRPPSPADIGLVKATGQTASATRTSTAPTCLPGSAGPSARRLRP